jgi:hypothetical protein
VVFDGGRLSSFEFSEPPREHFVQAAQVESVLIVGDLLSEPSPNQPLPSHPPFLNRIQSEVSITSVDGPRSDTEIREYLSSLSMSVPVDYVNLLHETNRFLAGNWTFVGTRARTVVLPDVEYVIVAESDDEAIALIEDESSDLLVRIDLIDVTVKEQGPEFTQMFVSAVKASGKPS